MNKIYVSAKNSTNAHDIIAEASLQISMRPASSLGDYYAEGRIDDLIHLKLALP